MEYLSGLERLNWIVHMMVSYARVWRGVIHMAQSCIQSDRDRAVSMTVSYSCGNQKGGIWRPSGLLNEASCGLVTKASMGSTGMAGNVPVWLYVSWGRFVTVNHSNASDRSVVSFDMAKLSSHCMQHWEPRSGELRCP